MSLTRLIDEHGGPNQVAREMLEAAGEDFRVSALDPRSLGNNVRALAGGNATWWRGERGRRYLPLLARSLSLTKDELEQLIVVETDQRQLLPIREFMELRPFDADEEDPPPGTPSEILDLAWEDPERPVWWVAPRGSFARLAGAWLARRAGWTVVEASTWAELEALTQRRTRVFVRLLGALAGSPHDPDLPDGRFVCVASPSTAPRGAIDERSRRQRDIEETRWRVVETPARDRWLGKLVGWVARRLVDADGGFTVEDAHAFLAGPVRQLLRTPGDAVGLMALLEHWGLERLREPQRWMPQYVRARVEEGTRSEVRREWLGIHAWGILLEATKERLRVGLLDALSREQWQSLVPARPFTQDEILEIVREDEDSGTLRERILEEVPPTQRGTVGLLLASGVFEEEEESDLVDVGPPWFRHYLIGAAFEQLLDEGRDALGALFLNVETAEAVLRGLCDRVAAGELQQIHACLAAGDPTKPETVAAVELAFMALGLAALEGAAIPADLASQTWALHHQFAVPRFSNLPPMPRLKPEVHDHSSLLSTSSYLAIALAIGRQLDEAQEPAALAPWWTDAPPAKLPDVIGMLGVAREGESALAAYELGSAIFDRFGVLVRDGAIPAVQLPSILLAGFLESDVAENEVRNALTFSFPVAALEQVTRSARVELSDVLRWCWERWAENERFHPPPLQWWHQGRRVEDARTLLKSIAPAVVGDRLAVPLADLPDEVWRDFPRDFLEAWTEWFITTQQHYRSSPIASLPHDLVERICRGHPHAATARGVLWRHHPDLLLRLLDEFMQDGLEDAPPGPDPAVQFIWASPEEQHGVLVGRIGRWLESPDLGNSRREALPRWLQYVLGTRGPCWREAYGILMRSWPPG